MGEAATVVVPLFKRCTKCGTDKPVSEFYKGGRKVGPSGRRASCKACCAKASSSAYHGTPRGERARAYRREWWRASPWPSRLLASAKAASKARVRRGRVCPLAIAERDLELAWEAQHGLCYFTGIPLSTELDRLDSVSIDRLDPTRGYEPGNVVLTTKAANFGRTGHSPDEYLGYLTRLVACLGKAPFAGGRR